MGSFEYDPIGRASVLTLLNRRIREPYVRWCERSTNQLMISLLLDSNHSNDNYSTVTDFATLRGLSTSKPLCKAV